MIKKILSNFGTRLFNAIFNLLLAVFISQYLGAAGKGEQSIIITSISILVLFCSLIGASSITYLVQRHPLHLLFIPAYLWTIVSGFLFSYLSYVTNLVNEKYVLHICILSILSTFTSINISVLVAKEEINKYNQVSLLQTITIIFSLLFYYFIVNNISIQSYISSLYISYLISFLFSCFFIKKYISFKTDKLQKYLPIIKQYASYGFYNQLGAIALLLSFRLSYFFLNKISGPEQVGIYSNGVSLAESIWLISRSIALVHYSKIVNSVSKTISIELTNNFHRMGFIIVCLCTLLLMALPSSLYVFIFGKEFADINLVIWTLSPGIIAFNTSLIIGHYFSGTGRYNIEALGYIIGFIVTISLSFIVIPKLHLVGAGLVSSISYMATALTLLFFYQKEEKGNLKKIIPNNNDFKEIKKKLTFFKELKSK